MYKTLGNSYFVYTNKIIFLKLIKIVRLYSSPGIIFKTKYFVQMFTHISFRKKQNLR